MANMQSKEVNLTKRVQTSKGMRYCPVVLSALARRSPRVFHCNGSAADYSKIIMVFVMDQLDS